MQKIFLYCIVYELNTWPPNPTNSYTLKNCLFDTVKLLRNVIKSKFTYNGWEKAFDEEDSQSCDDDFARNVIIFSVGNTSSSHAHNQKNKFLALDEKPTDAINDSTGVA